MALNTQISFSFNPTLTKSHDSNVVATDPFSLIRRLEYLTGVGAGQADKLWYDERLLTTGANETLDLSGVLVDTFGDTFTVARIKAFAILAESAIAGTPANTTDLIFGAAAANPWIGFLNSTGTIVLKPGMLQFACCGPSDAVGMVVTGGTGDQFKASNAAGASASYQIAIVAASA